ncbi:MAG: 4-alpha-glucanotransferase [Treponema sp.]|jgi:4-alpha-glucanotransferase|nr:4-alpha-glucanotransferase [Treponema sp.]
MAAKKGQGVKERLLGTVVPVGALRGEKSTGVGEFLDLIEFAKLCTKMEIGLIQILPVNDTGNFSAPYFALTAFALHPLYLRIGDMPEASAFRADIADIKARFDRENRFPYEKILRAKMDLLRKIYQANRDEIVKKTEKTGSLAAFIQKNPWVKEYAVYRRLKEANEEKSWQEWDARGQVTAEDIEALWNDKAHYGEHLFWVWIQEALDKQFSVAAKAVSDLGIILEGDIPILMNEDSCDVWAHREFFDLNLSAGAPPDMYSPDGQNWGFPLHDWNVQSGDNYSWWKNRLKVAEKYYGAYRIDHVLGFFRIWASRRGDNSAALGRYVPYLPVTAEDLEALNFDQGRIRWISYPHIPTGEVWDSLRNNGGGPFKESEIAFEAEKVFTAALDRIGGEELWLFKETIKGEKDIEALGLHPAARSYLLKAWSNRILMEYEKDRYSPVWYYRDSRAYASLSDKERQELETLLEKKRVDSEQIWEEEGKRLLTMLSRASSMLPCAEDLGAVPDCVPRVLAELNILGLRVIRWFREWDREGQPYIPFDAYPELSVCSGSVHDSSTLREWWDKEADQELFSGFIGVPSLPRVYNPGTAKIILQKTAAASSRFKVFPIQDLLHLSNTREWWAEDPASERINVPGTNNEFNWTYRLPVPIKEIEKDGDLIKAVQELAAICRGKAAKASNTNKGKK